MTILQSKLMQYAAATLLAMLLAVMVSYALGRVGF
jgi:hypothetical protein